jgi:hypothetical protein
MFQKDYDSMAHEDIKKLAEKYNISLPGRWDTESGFDRAIVISQLRNRDAALQTNYALIISFLSLILSIAAIVLNLIR